MNTCITIDVSQDKSYVQAFLSVDKPFSKPKLIKHFKDGFNFIIELFNKLNSLPLIIFEYTGIYHKPLERLLKKNNLTYNIISPLRAAKARKNDLRSVKTDKRDCLALAKMFYSHNLGLFTAETRLEHNLKSLNRLYTIILKQLQEVKVHFRECLAVIYPCYKFSKNSTLGAFKEVYSFESLNFLKAFPHPELIPSEKLLINVLPNLVSNSRKNQINLMAKRLYTYVSSCFSGCSVDDQEVANLIYYIHQIEFYQARLDSIIKQMVEKVDNLPLFKTLIIIPGIKDNLAARFICEAGNLSRFKHYKSLIAFCGTDPMVFQSGDYTGNHLSISKKGNKHLRTILHLMVNQMIKTDSVIKSFYQ
jgi:transposase